MTDSTSETIGEEAVSWLHQFEATVKSSLPNIKAVVEQGLTELENKALIEFAAELIKLAEVHDPSARAEVDALLDK
jgi:hypothetical protein